MTFRHIFCIIKDTDRVFLILWYHFAVPLAWLLWECSCIMSRPESVSEQFNYQIIFTWINNDCVCIFLHIYYIARSTHDKLKISNKRKEPCKRMRWHIDSLVIVCYVVSHAIFIWAMDMAANNVHKNLIKIKNSPWHMLVRCRPIPIWLCAIFLHR